MSLTHVNTVSLSANSTAATAYSITIPAGQGILAGDLIVVCADGTGTHASNGMAVQDNINATPYTTIRETQQGGASTHWLQTFYYATPLNFANDGTDLITFTPYASSTLNSFSVDVFRSTSQAISQAVVFSSVTSGTSFAASALGSAPATGDLVLTFCGATTGTLTQGSPFTLGSSANTNQSTAIGYVLGADGSTTYASTWTDGATSTAATQTVAFGSAGSNFYLAGAAAFSSGSTSTAVTIGAASGSQGTKVGDAVFIIDGVGSASVTPSSQADSKSQTYVQVATEAPGNGMCSYVSALFNSGSALVASSDTVTTTWNSTSNNKAVIVVGASNVATSALDSPAAAAASGTSTAPAVTSGALTAAGELCLAVVVAGSASASITFAAGWTQLGTTQHTGGGSYMAVAAMVAPSTSPVTVSATLGSSAVWSAQVVPFTALVHGGLAGTTPTIATTSPLPNATAGVAYTYTLAATGGTPPYTWSSSGASLPAGLSLSAGGPGGGTDITHVSANGGPNGSAGQSLSDYTAAQNAIGPLTGIKLFYGGDLGAWTDVSSSSGSSAGVSPAALVAAYPNVVPLVCWNGPSGVTPSSAATITSFLKTIPSGQRVGLCWQQEPENPTSGFSSGSQYTSGFTQIARAIHSFGNPNFFTVHCSTWGQYGPSGGRAYDGSYLPPAVDTDVYGMDIYQHQAGGSLNGGTTWSTNGLSNNVFWTRWVTLVKPLANSLGRPLAITEYGIDDTGTTAARNTRLQADYAYIQGAFGTGGSVSPLPLFYWLYWWHNMAASNAQYKFTDSAAEATWKGIASASSSSGGASTGGTISGTPTTAHAAVSPVFKVTDSTTTNSTKPLSITVLAASSLAVATTSPLTGADVGIPYSVLLQASGGTPPYTWDNSSGTPPTGLSLSAAGVISGSPSTPATTSATYRVTDNVSATATASLSVTVSVQPTFSTTSLAAGTVGAAYTGTLTASGGTSPYSWGVGSGTLPDGLTLDPLLGVISGTPTTPGSPALKFTMTDAAGATVTSAQIILAVAIGSGGLPPLPRFVFGGGQSDFGFQFSGSNLAKAAAVAYSFWTAKTAGTQITDLTDMSNAAISSGLVTSDSSGFLPEFHGPAGVIEMYADSSGSPGTGPRYRVTAQNLSSSYIVLYNAVKGVTG